MGRFDYMWLTDNHYNILLPTRSQYCQMHYFNYSYFIIRNSSLRNCTSSYGEICSFFLWDNLALAIVSESSSFFLILIFLVEGINNIAWSNYSFFLFSNFKLYCHLHPLPPKYNQGQARISTEGVFPRCCKSIITYPLP